MADIQYNIKTQVEDYDPNLWNAQDANEVKTAVNSKADLTALQGEIDNRVNAHTVIVNDIYDLKQADISLQTQIDNISVGGGGEVDLTNYYTKLQSDSRFLSTGTTLFNGNYNSLTNKPIIPSVTGLASETWVNSQGFIKSFTQDFNYNSLLNKPDLTLKVDKDGSKVLTDVNFTAALNSKLSGISIAATANQTDAYLLSLTNATGSLPASNVTQLATARFVTDTEKATWNGKVNTSDISGFISNTSDTFGAKVTQIVSCTAAEYADITPVATTFYIIT